MADLAQSITQIDEADRGLLHAASGILALAFLIKAAVWPLNFWLVPAYNAATAPVGAFFAIMTKVGIYAILRLWTLLFGIEAGASSQFGSNWLVIGGMLTMVFGALGMLGSQRLGRLAGYGAILSSGSLLAAIGFGQTQLTAGLLYYLPSSTLAISALFLLSDLIDRWRNDGATVSPFGADAPFLNEELVPTRGLNLDEDEEVLTGRVIPAAAAFLGLSFIAGTLVIAGLPPLSGFVGKLAMLNALLNPLGLGASGKAIPGATAWIFLALLIVTGLLALIALTRVGILHFWTSRNRNPPQLRLLEGWPVAGLLFACVLLTVQAGPVMRYMQATAETLHTPAIYINAVMSALPVMRQSAPYPGVTKESP
jgi:multicomponent K+:H+ antiporter subunit D